MKIVLLVFLYIASAQAGVLKDDLKESGPASTADYRIHQIQLVRVNDFYQNGNITLVTEILIEVTKNKESQANNIETDTGHLTSGLHKWVIRFLSSQQPAEEINRILGIVETAAKKTGQVIDKCCTTRDIAVTCIYVINVGVTNESKSEVHKREIPNNTQVVDEDETERESNEADSAGNKIDIKNCDSDLLVLRDDEVFRDEVSVFSVGCPTGTARADDNTCVPIEV